MEAKGVQILALSLIFLYHIEALPGGFVGFDVLFVIYGYIVFGPLMSETIQSSDCWTQTLLQIRKFSIPSTICLAFLLIPVLSSKETNPTDLISAAFQTSNFYGSSIQYFSQETKENLVLHYWSISLGHQVALILSIILILFSKFSSKQQIPLICLTGLSFVTCFVLPPTDRFYLLPSRLWEFCVGILVYHYKDQFPEIHFPLEYIYFPLLCLSGFFFKIDTYPIVTNLIIVSITVIALFHKRQISFIEERLSPLIQIITKISFHIYLYHWPVIVLTKKTLMFLGIDISKDPTNGALNLLLIVIFTCALSLISYFIEKQLKRLESFPISFWIWLFIGLSVGISLVVVASQMKYSPHSTDQKIDSTSINRIKLLYQAELARGGYPVPNEQNHLFFTRQDLTLMKNVPGSQKCLVLYGDSHAAQWYPFIDYLSQITKSNIWLGVGIMSQDIGIENSDAARNTLEDWMNPNFPQGFSESCQESVVTFLGFYTSAVTNEGLLHSNLVQIVNKMDQKSNCIVLFEDTPSWSRQHPITNPNDCLNSVKNISECKKTKQETLARFESSLKALKIPKLEIVSVESDICPVGDDCPANIGEMPLYRDWHHLSHFIVMDLSPKIYSRLQKSVVCLQ